MLGVAIRFPAGRFHATPWGRHVNEGAPEWPLSPWRLLRALLATWKRKLGDRPECAATVMERILRQLAEPARYVLPPASTGHTRHYMPWKGPGDKTLVFDAFVAVSKSDELLVLWPDVTLDPTEQSAFELLLANLGSLGRAESWAEARALSGEEAVEASAKTNCFPSGAGMNTKDLEPVRVLCADPALAFANEHTPKILRSEGKGKSKQTIKSPMYDPDWHLCMETAALHDEGWSDPPGSKWVTYFRRRDCFAITPKHISASGKQPRPTVVRFALDAAVLPLVQDTLKIAEKARITAMGCYRRIEEERLYLGPTPDGKTLPRSEVFSGKDADGKPLSGHAHAYYLPTDEDGDGRLDHLTILAEMGFGPAEVKALDRMRQVKRDDCDPIRLVMLDIGKWQKGMAARVVGPSRVWASATPFIATRHPKENGTKRDPAHLLGPHNQRAFARAVLTEEIARLRERCPEIPEPVSVMPLNDEHRCSAHLLRPIQFKRFRQKRSDDGGRRPTGAFKIVFPEPVIGPICLGHSSHFGLGLFVPIEK